MAKRIVLELLILYHMIFGGYIFQIGFFLIQYFTGRKLRSVFFKTTSGKRIICLQGSPERVSRAFDSGILNGVLGRGIAGIVVDDRLRAAPSGRLRNAGVANQHLSQTFVCERRRRHRHAGMIPIPYPVSKTIIHIPRLWRQKPHGPSLRSDDPPCSTCQATRSRS